MNIFSVITPTTQVEDLKAVIGKEVSQNQSPTLRAKLIKVGKASCLFEAVQSPYVKYPQMGVSVQYRVPNSIAWNSFFY